MNSYIQQLFPFVDMGNFVKNTTEVVDAVSIYCPVEFEVSDSGNVVTKSQKNPFNAYKITPCNVIVVDEQDSTLKDIKTGVYGDRISLNITELDYSDIASRIDVIDNMARVQMNKGYMGQEILSDIFINSASNGFNITSDMIPDVTIKPEKKVSFKDWITSSIVNESADAYKDLLNDFNNGKLESDSNKRVDSVYEWLDAYFALPEGASTKARSEVPLLIGPTGVFKSSTVKELCKKYGYRLIDFRAAFTSRLDYSGLYQMGSIDDQLYSYACPMEELVTCSDGFIEYCRRAYDRVSKILSDGYIISDKVSDGESEEGNQVTLSEEQREKLEGLLTKYKEYMKPVCLFVDEITRVRDSGVNGILTEMLNQKRFNNMPMKNCKFVAATNANLLSRTDERHNQLMDDLDRMYDVNDELDIAFSNRFIPLLVRPEDVQDRWFDWAKSQNKISKDGTSKVSNIHEIVIEYLEGVGFDQVYNDKPILDAIEAGLTDNEQKSQPFPNYRTWDMVSSYMYSIDSDYEMALKDAPTEKDKENIKKVYRPKVIKGLISDESGQLFIDFLRSKGYVDIETSLGREVDDEYSDFLQTSLDAGVPALMVGPSSIGKTSRVEQYMKRQKDRTGLEPVLINIDLASKDAVDLMGMPAKVSLVEYVAGKDLEDMGLGEVKKELGDTVKSVQQEDMYGLSDFLTVRAPDLDAKNSLIKAQREGREVIFFFDECFTGDTKIRLYDGRVLSFYEINDEYSERDEFLVYSLDENGDLVPGKAHTLGVTRRNSELVKILLSNGISLKCTPEHPFMLEDGTYCEARDLESGVELSAGNAFNDDIYVPIKITVDSVSVIDEIADVYDIEVEEYHNFLVDIEDGAGIFVHNCNRVKSTTVLSSMFECFSGDTKIKLLDGTSESFENIYNRAESGDTDMWVYSMNERGNFVPGRICRALKKPVTSEMIRVYFDNDTYVDCTEDHKFRLSDGTYKEAKYLTEEDDISEFEFSVSCKRDGDYIDGYTFIKNRLSDEWRYVHKAVSMIELGWCEHNGKVIHHKDFNKLNNAPDNLNVDMTYLEHITYHGNHLQEMKDRTNFEEKRIKGLKKKFKESKDSGALVGREMSNETISKISETRKRKCREDEEYKKRISSALMEYNEKVKSGEIVKDYSYLSTPEMREVARARAIENNFGDRFKEWRENNPEWYEKHRSFMRNQWKKPAYREMQSNIISKRDKDPEMQKKMYLGRVKSLILVYYREYNSLDMVEDNISKLRKEGKYSYRGPGKKRIVSFFEKNNMDFMTFAREVIANEG